MALRRPGAKRVVGAQKARLPGEIPKIILSSQKPIGTMVARHLVEMHEKKQIEILAIATNLHPQGWWNSNEVHELANQNSIQVISNEKRVHLEEFIYSLKDLVEAQKVWLVSIQHPWVLSSAVIELFQGRTINLHLAPLPAFKGWYGPSLAILKKRKWFGWTLHRMESNLDSGGIYSKHDIKILKSESAYSLYNRVSSSAFEGFKSIVIQLNQEAIVSKRQIGKGDFYTKESLNSYRTHTLSDRDELTHKVRGLYFPTFPLPILKIEIDGEVHSFELKEIPCSD